MTKKQSVTVDQNSNQIAALRNDAAKAVGSEYGAFREYAKALNSLFSVLPVFDGKYWWEVKGDAKGAEFAPVLAELKMFYGALKAVNCTNPSVYGARIRKFGYEESGVKPVAAEGEGTEGEGEGEGAGAKARPIKGRMVEELSKLYKARFDEKYASQMTDEVRAAHLHIEKALLALNVDVVSLVDKK